MSNNSSKTKRDRSNDDSKRSPAKRQFRNENEKRRRDLFSQLIQSLEDILDIDKQVSSDSTQTKSNSQTNKLDKASILRETASFLKKHQNNLIFPTTNRTQIDRANDILDFSWKPPLNLVNIEEWIETTIQSMNCFFLVAKSDPHNAQIVYVSKNISSLLDYSQNELLNRSLFELILPRDHDQLKDYLLKDHRVLERCEISWRRATADEYEQCTIIGAFRQIINRDNDGKYLMSLVHINGLDRNLFPNNSNLIQQFGTRLNLHGQFIHIDSKTRDLLGYTSYELIGRTHFDFVHPDDLPIILRAHQIWKENGNGKSDPYRFLSKGQQWIFLQTDCQVQINSWTGKPDSYLCTSTLLINPTDSLQRQSSSLSLLTVTSTGQSELTGSALSRTNISTRRSSTDSQITTFLSHLGNEIYRKNIREKLNERRSSKQAEICVREDEIKVIEDIIQFIDEFQTKQTNKSLSRSNDLSTFRTTNDRTNEQDCVNEFESEYGSTLFRSSLMNVIEDFSPQYSPLVSRQELIRDETIVEHLSTQLFSPQQGPFSIPSPITPFSIPRPSPITPNPLSVSPSSPLITTTTQDIVKPPSISSSSSSSSTEQTSKKSSFNRSLPKSLVS